MTGELGEPPPEEYEQPWFRRAFQRIERAIPPTVVIFPPQRLELNTDNGHVPLVNAPYDMAIRRVLLWSPVDVAPSATLYTVLDVRNKERNVSLVSLPGGFSTSGGLQQWAWKLLVGFDAESDGPHGADMEMARNETLWMTWEHYRQATPAASVGTGLGSEQVGQPIEVDPPEETGALLVEAWVQVEGERS